MGETCTKKGKDRIDLCELEERFSVANAKHNIGFLEYDEGEGEEEGIDCETCGANENVFKLDDYFQKIVEREKVGKKDIRFVNLAVVDKEYRNIVTDIMIAMLEEFPGCDVVKLKRIREIG